MRFSRDSGASKHAEDVACGVQCRTVHPTSLTTYTHTGQPRPAGRVDGAGPWGQAGQQTDPPESRASAHERRLLFRGSPARAFATSPCCRVPVRAREVRPERCCTHAHVRRPVQHPVIPHRDGLPNYVSPPAPRTCQQAASCVPGQGHRWADDRHEGGAGSVSKVIRGRL